MIPDRMATGYRFDGFEADAKSGELRRDGRPLRLQEKPFQLLITLLEQPGEVVGHDELRRRLWPADTFVDFEAGIKVAAMKLRDALGDSAECPRYVENLPRRGYRFIGKVEAMVGSASEERAESQVEPGVDSRLISSGARGRTLWMVGSAVLVVVLCGLIAYRMLQRPAPAFHRGDWILITDFQNTTGERLLDHALEYALARELSNSTFASVVPQPRVEDALRLMKQPLDSKITPEIGRQICLRDGEIKALITGRVEKLGTTYVLSAQIVDPSDGATVATLSEEDPAEAQLAEAVRRISNRVREALGEQVQSISQSNERLEKVTTPSLHALELYTRADRTIAQGGNSNQVAAELLKQALEEDPDFASAHLLLGYAYDNQNKPAEAARHFRRAFELADKTTERERYFILASYYGHAPIDQLEQAAEIYETLLRRYPDHRWAANNLTMLYNFMGEPDKAFGVRLQMAAMRPNAVDAQVGAAYVFFRRELAKSESAKLGTTAKWAPDLTQAHQYLDRAIALRNEQGIEEPGRSTTNSPRLLSAEIRWMEGRFAESHADVIEAGQFGKQIQPSTMAAFYAAFGNLREAEKRLDGDSSQLSRPLLADYRGDQDAVRACFRGVREIVPQTAMGLVLMTHAGLYREAEAIYRKARRNNFGERPGVTISSTTAEGELALARGETARGIAILEKTLANANTSITMAQMAAEDVAEAYRAQGRRADAVRVLERFAGGPVLMGNFAAAWQMRVQLRLLQLYLEVGRAREAAQVEEILTQKLAFADPDDPIVRQLVKLRQSPRVVAPAN